MRLRVLAGGGTAKRERKSSAIGALAVGLLLAAAVSRGLDPRTPIARLARDVWDSDSGLPQNSVEVVLQTADGYLWFGTQEGLVRFDGVRFTIFDTHNTPAMGDAWVRSLCQTRDGTLWVGTFRGLMLLRDGVFRAWDPGGPLSRAEVDALVEVSDGSLWVGSSLGVRHIRDGIEMSLPSDLARTRARAIAEDREGGVWLGGWGCTGRFHAGLWTEWSEDRVPGAAASLIVDRRGALWVASARGVARVENGQTTSYGPAQGLDERAARVVYEDREGSVWAGTDRGLYLFAAGRFVAYPGPLSSQRILALREDREGSLWIGTHDGGVSRIREQRIANITRAEGLTDDRVWTVYEDHRGDLWVATDDGTLSRIPAGGSSLQHVAKLGSTVLAMAEDRDGNFWAATRSSGLYRFHRGRVKRFTTADGIAGEWISSLCPDDDDGSLWIGTGNGLNRYRGGRFETFRVADGLPSAQIFCLMRDRDGDLWIGTIGGGLSRRHAGAFTNYGTSDGLAHDTVISVFQDYDGTFWIGTRGGLSRLRGGRFTTYRYREGLFHDAVQRVLEDGRGYLWLTTNHGIFRVSKVELESAATPGQLLHPVGFSTGNGMHAVECNNGQQGAVRTRDGRLWFATLKGLAMADPKRIRLNPVPPPVVLESVLAGGEALPGTTGLRLSPGSRNLEFRYTALAFVNPAAIHFKYRLEGFDAAWLDAGSRRTAYYTNIPPGRYRFVVRACNEDGVWSERGAVSELSIAPHVYETAWFRALVVVVLAGAGLVAHLLRLRRMRTREALRRALVESQLQALKLQLRPHFLFNTLNSILPLIVQDPAAAARMVVQLGELLRLSLKTGTAQQVTLAEELAFLDSYLEIERTRFRDRLHVTVDAETEAEEALVPVFLLQPLVENALKHGMDSTGRVRVRIQAKAEGDRLALSVSDDGPGYPPGVYAFSNGIGLKNTRRRLEMLYPGRASLEISNSPDGGGIVRILFPRTQATPRPAA
jgi:ligand-binding sensor domain-containing protein/signal transduction histidine kinase